MILEFLEDAFPQRPLLPSDPLARSKVSLHPSLARMYIPSSPASCHWSPPQRASFLLPVRRYATLWHAAGGGCAAVNSVAA